MIEIAMVLTNPVLQYSSNTESYSDSGVILTVQYHSFLLRSRAYHNLEFLTEVRSGHSPEAVHIPELFDKSRLQSRSCHLESFSHSRVGVIGKITSLMLGKGKLVSHLIKSGLFWK
jgi:hypothetical protein